MSDATRAPEVEITATHDVFDRDLPAAAAVASGAVVRFHCPGPDLPPNATAADLARLDLARPHVIAGPVEVAGAAAGDAIAIDVLALELAQDYGHTLVIPGAGLLAEDFDSAYVHNFKLADGFAELSPGVRVALEPFCGILGLAPQAPGPHSTIPPRRVGGNLDIRDLTVGSRLLLPVEVAGGLFSCGDGHAAQGDGEVCVTAIETALTATLRLELVPGQAPDTPQFTTAARRVRRGGGGWFGVSAIGEDLLLASREAVRGLIAHLVATRGLAREAAYVLVSVAADLRVNEVVNAPAFVVSAQIPLEVFV